MIHGRTAATSGTWAPLRPTHGCVRVSNTDQLKITDLVARYGGTGYIGIYDPQKEQP